MTRARRLWLVTHRYVGLVFGALFVLLGLTGSIPVFHQELDEWLNPQLLTVQSSRTVRPLDDLVNAARHAFPEWRGPKAIKLPRTPESALRLTFEAQKGGGARIEVAVDPYTARVLGRRDADGHLVAIIYAIHYRLLLDQGIGLSVVGIAGLFMILSSITGLKLWMPRWQHLKSALTVKWSAGAKRINFDLHRASGLWSFGVIVIVAFTGAVMCFYDYLQAVVGLALRVTSRPTVSSPISNGRGAIELQRLLAAANAQFPNAVVGYLSTPLQLDEPYIIWLRQPGEVADHSATPAFG